MSHRHAFTLTFAISAFAVATHAADYQQDVAPLLAKYCAGCHNNNDREGELSLQDFGGIQRGGENGAAIVPGNPNASRLVRLMRGLDEPAMPPEDNPQPTAAEVQKIADWIEAGASGPDGASTPLTLKTPKIAPPANLEKPITALDWSPKGIVAAGVFGEVLLLASGKEKEQSEQRLENLPGKVTSVRFTTDGTRLVATSGATGLAGWAGVWDMSSRKLIQEFRGHYDAIQTAAFSPDGKLLATGSYDRRILLWNVESGALLRELTGHNGAIYDLDFNADGSILASASGDETVKLWRVSDGLRLDTLSQPGKEQYTVRFSPDDKFVAAGGADNRIRVWRVVSRSQPRINPLVHSRFAHEGAVSHLRYTADGKHLISAAEDLTLKVWSVGDYEQLHVLPPLKDVLGGMAISSDGQAALGRLDGKLRFVSLPKLDNSNSESTEEAVEAQASAGPVAALNDTPEHEPNDEPATAQSVTLPAMVHGTIHHSDSEPSVSHADQDVFRISAKAGQAWVLEINAARNKSKLDSRIEVLHANGEPVQRVLLQAMRDSYFTFRGKDSNTSDDFRVQNWREMELNQYLYCNGEVVKLWHYPRGPDSGFMVYPGSGKRHTYFGTTAMAHALHEPCYIVQPLPVGSEPLPNGLPSFPIYYENDDDPLRAWGGDSRLTFTAPEDGEYLVRVSDIRGQHGEDYKYDLTIRPQRPDFKVSLSGANPTINAGSGKEISLNIQRIDGYAGPAEVLIENMPPGVHCHSPVTIEPGQNSAFAAIWTDADVKQPTEEQWKAVKVTATATIQGKQVTHPVNGLGKITIAEPPKVTIRVVRSGEAEAADAAEGPVELTLAPGETITAEVIAERAGYDGRISLGKHDAGRNMPHGVFVDNIGLNGLMIVAGQTRREFFITAAPFVADQTRVFHLKTAEAGNQTTTPIVLHIRNP